MKKGIIGKKIGMTQIFDEKGNIIPVTVIETAGNIVAQVKTVETDGYDAIQLGYGEVKDKHINKPEAGHFAKAKLANKKHLREFRIEDVASYKVGDMGRVTITIQNLDVIKVDMDKNVLLVKGSVPGAKGAILKVKSAVKAMK